MSAWGLGRSAEILLWQHPGGASAVLRLVCSSWVLGAAGPAPVLLTAREYLPPRWGGLGLVMG